MPLFEYQCRDCGEKFEELVLGAETGIVCPKCGSDQVGRLMSTFASSGTSSGGGCSAPSGSGFT